MKTHKKLENNEIIFSLNSKIYPRDVIFKACYTFIDRVYIFLDNPKRNEITVSFKGKKILTKKQLNSLKGEFANELLNAILRKDISKKNKKILEYVVGGAITAALEKPEENKGPENEDDVEIKKIEKEIEALKKELESEGPEDTGDDYESDPLGIMKTQ
ncbi:MAG: His-Xaa-Ser system protein HxsD [Candidatus Omnitrophica bacterium]|nr:His-Xaa-Ser system protein HxsD [Candidatus Omnitrophota bacterium]